MHRHFSPAWIAFVATTLLCGCGPTNHSADQRNPPVVPATPDEPSISEIELSVTPEGKVRISHREPWGTGFTEFDAGQGGKVQSTDPTQCTLTVAFVWQSATSFKASIEFDSKEVERSLKLTATGFSNFRASQHGKEISLPAEFPPGKHRVFLKGDLP